MTDSTSHAGDEHSEELHGGFATYFAIFVALVILTGFSFAIGSFGPGYLSASVVRLMMIVISIAKAMLVILFFMHLKWEANWKYVLTVPAMMMSLVIIGVLFFEFGARTLKYPSERWFYAAEPAVAVEHGGGAH